MTESNYPQKCPFCETEVANLNEELAHMNAKHPDVIEKRLLDANIRIEDYRQGPDLPSYLTIRELQTVMVFALRYALELDMDVYHEGVMIGIHVRDRGMASRAPAPWVEFSVGVKKFALWRRTLDLYEIGPDGAVSDEPIHRND